MILLQTENMVIFLMLFTLQSLIMSMTVVVGDDERDGSIFPLNMQTRRSNHLQVSNKQARNHTHKHVHRCYQCAYSPPKKHNNNNFINNNNNNNDADSGVAVNQEFTSDTKEVFINQMERKEKQKVRNGGWDKCLGPFNHQQAKEYGVDTWDCHTGNCYVRKDPNGDIFRGCYKDEHNVDPHKFGCHQQAGATYCFCEGELCNNGSF